MAAGAVNVMVCADHADALDEPDADHGDALDEHDEVDCDEEKEDGESCQCHGWLVRIKEDNVVANVNDGVIVDNANDDERGGELFMNHMTSVQIPYMIMMLGLILDPTDDNDDRNNNNNNNGCLQSYLIFRSRT